MPTTRTSLAPLPWRIDPESVGVHWTNSISIVDADGAEVCVFTRGYQGDAEGDPCPSWDNAHWVVEAVNDFLMPDAET